MRRWTKEEVESFKEEWGTVSAKTLAKKYGREEKRIKEKAYRLGLESERFYKSFYTVSYLAYALGYDVKAFYKTKVFNTMPVVNMGNGRGKLTKINHSKFWKWARDNKEHIDFSRYKIGVLSPEPKWLKDEMKINKRRVSTLWTVEEEKLLILYYDLGKDISFIANKLNRSYTSISHKVNKLGKAGQIKLKKVNLRWRQEEIDILKQMLSEGCQHKEIAERLGREAYHITDKCRRIKVDA